MSTKFSIEIDDGTLEALWQFCTIDSKGSMVENIERVIEINVVTGTVRQFEMEKEMSMLFEVKRLIEALPIHD